MPDGLVSQRHSSQSAGGAPPPRFSPCCHGRNTLSSLGNVIACRISRRLHRVGREAWRHRGGTIRVTPMPRARFTTRAPHFYVLHFHVGTVCQTVTQPCREIDHTNTPSLTIIPFLGAWVQPPRFSNSRTTPPPFFMAVQWVNS